MIQYIRPEIPRVDIPSYGGQHYEDTVPDTLDIAEMAELAINVLTRATDPDADYELYWHAGFRRNPPFMFHDWNDLNQIKFMEALPLPEDCDGKRFEFPRRPRLDGCGAQVPRS